MRIKQYVLLIVIVAVSIIALINLRSYEKETYEPAVNIEELNQQLESIKSDNESGLFELEQQKKSLNELEEKRAQLEETLL